MHPAIILTNKMALFRRTLIDFSEIVLGYTFAVDKKILKSRDFCKPFVHQKKTLFHYTHYI